MTVEEYLHFSNEEKEKLFKKLKPNLNFEVAIRKRKTKNMKKLGDKQLNGKLTFIEELKRTDSNTTNLYYLCQCECGNFHIVKNGEFDTESSLSCGCYRKTKNIEFMRELGKSTYKDISNEIFGDLKAIEPINRGNNESLIWKCICIKCGHEQKVDGSLLRNHHRRFCELCNTNRKSIGEQKIRELLNNANILYQVEKTFDDCKFEESNYHARFDFYVENKYLIEFDGEQHFFPTKFPGMTDEDAIKAFSSNQLRDKYKNEWCKKNNIPLIRIPYTHLQNICLEDLIPETSNFLFV